jgi:hypothetical protein
MARLFSDAECVAIVSAASGRQYCPPPAVNGTPRTVTAPVGPLRGVGTRLSNLDLNGRLVRKGVTVSYYGARFLVTKVSRGWFYGRAVSCWGRPVEAGHGLSGRYQCELVQVVV